MDSKHVPVLVHEVVDLLNPQEGKVYIDATFGAGGYTKAIMSKAKCHIIAFDRDPDVCAGEGVEFYNVAFSQMDQFVKQKVDGIVFDFGVSSMQLDQAERGFSFQKEGPLDMRMSKSGLSAYDVINRFKEKELADIIYYYGEERYARRIAKAIVTNRPLHTTKQLADLIKRIVPSKKIHPATKTFQAIRIYVNDELKEIQNGLLKGYNLLKIGGKIITVSFHALEDRIIKTFIKAHQDLKKIAKCKPSFKEIRANPRSRSAILRCVEKVKI